MEIAERIEACVLAAIEGADVNVTDAGGGHFEIKVVSAAFQDKSLLQKQRLVYSAIADLMKGADAPVHAIDKLQTLLPES
jgi:stress-induced morphogen